MEKANVKKTPKRASGAGRKFRGLVVSDKMDKTIVVEVTRVVKHEKYQKRYSRSRRFKVHDEKNVCHEGDQVVFVECRPLAKEKRWRVLYDRQSPSPEPKE